MARNPSWMVPTSRVSRVATTKMNSTAASTTTAVTV